MLVSVSGVQKKEYMDKKISFELEKIIEERRTILISKRKRNNTSL